MSSNLAFLFPGQGSQSVGMFAELFESESIVKETFDQASAALGYDLSDVVLNGPVEKLNQTHITQPAILTASVAMWRLWKAKGGVQPAYFAGHSLGEYTALVAAEVLELEQAVKLVEKRGQLMQSAVPQGEGAMAAIIGLSDDKVQEACSQSTADALVSPVNYNAPGQVVIAGHKAAVEQAMLAAKELGAKRALPLPVSAPSHCALMQPAALQLATEFEKLEFKVPTAPIVQNVDAQPTSNPEQIQANLIKQLHQPVLWVDTIKTLNGLGVAQGVECGPGKVLAGLTKRIIREFSVTTTESLASFETSLNSVEK